MFLYIQHKELVRRFSDVTLHEFSVPRCGHVMKDGLDPSLWFKVLMLDSMLVDCDRQNIFLNRDRAPEKEEIHGFKDSQISVDLVWDFFQSRERIFDEKECPEYDPNYDDLFDTALMVIQQLVKGDESVATEHLFRLLHMFVLPKLKIKKEDRRKLKRYLTNVETKHNEIEKEIKRTLRSEVNTEHSLDEQTKDLIRKNESFSRGSYVASCDNEFLDIFLQRLDKYVAQCRDEMQSFTQKIAPIKHSKERQDIKQLKILRSERALLHERFNNAIMVREEIRLHLNSLDADHEKVRKSSFDFQIAYVKTFRCLQMNRMEIRKMIKIKIRMSAVREAILFTLKELESDGYSYGYCCIKGSIDVESDISELDSVPEEWTTLGARIAALLQNPQDRYISMHTQFCDLVKEKCQQLQNEIKIKSGCGRNRKSSLCDATEENSYTSRWSSGNISKETCEGICIRVNCHISDMSEDLCRTLGHDCSGHFRIIRNKVYMCYGERILGELMSVLCSLYEESYRDLVQDLADWMVSVPITKLCGGGEIKILDRLTPQYTTMLDKERHEEHVYDTPMCFTQQESEYASMRIIPETIENKPDAILEASESEMETHTNVNSDRSEDKEDQMRTDSPKPYEYESMRKGIKTIENKPGAIPKDPEREMETYTDVNSERSEDNEDQMKTDPAKHLERQDVVSRTRSASRRKRDGMSLTADQAKKLMSELADENVNDNNEVTDSSSTDVYVDMKSGSTIVKQLRFEFPSFDSLVRKVIDAESMSTKLRAVADILQYIESRINAVNKTSGTEELISADDLLDVVILLLYQLGSDDLLKLYAHINLLTQLCPNFMDGNIHAYALATLCGGYIHLFEQAKHSFAAVSEV